MLSLYDVKQCNLIKIQFNYLNINAYNEGLVFINNVYKMPGT